MCMIAGGYADPVVAVGYREPVHVRDSGFFVNTTSCPPKEEATEDDVSFYCLACLKEAHPEAGRGLQLARAYGFAWWDDEEGSWMARDDDGNEILFASGDERRDE
jgi:hypothetical protein